MTLLEEIRKDSLTARKERDTIRANLLTTLLSECQALSIGRETKKYDPTDPFIARTDSGEVTDEKIIGIIKKFIKNIDVTLKAIKDGRVTVQSSFFVDLANKERTILDQYLRNVLVGTDLDFKPIVDQLITDNQDKFEYCRTNPKNLGWFIGQTMKVTGGKANPASVQEYLMERMK